MNVEMELRGGLGASMNGDTSLTDSEVIAASCDDPVKFDIIFVRYFDVIHRYLYRRVGQDVADDLAAQTFLEALRSRYTYDRSRGDARPWLFGIASNLLRHHYRDEQRELAAFARSGVDPVTTELDSTAPQSLSVQLAGALAALSPQERDVLFLFAWADLGYQEIADALGVPIGTVRSRLSRARGQLQARLGRSDAAPLDDSPGARSVLNG